MKTIVRLIIILVCFISCKEEKYKYDISDFRNELRPSLNNLSKEESLPAKDTAAKIFLEKNATKEELIMLMDSKNPFLRIIAYRIIVDKQIPEYYDLLLGHLSDTARVQWWFYDDVLESKQVSDMMIIKAHNQNGLSPIQKKHLIENVLLKHPYLDISAWMIHDIEPNEKYYNLIKQRTEKKGEFCRDQLSACYALIKFKKNEDIDLLYNIFEVNLKKEDCLMWIFRSIEEYPNPKFYPLLEKHFVMNIKGKLSPEENISDDVLYFSRAIASYKNEKAWFFGLFSGIIKFKIIS